MQQRIQHAFQLLQQGHRQQAEQICRSVLAHYPNQPDALNLIGLLERERGSLKQARQLFLKGLKKAPGHLHLMNSVGLVEQDLGEFAKSEAHFHRVLKIAPAHFQARYNLANLYQTQGKFETAKKLYQQVIRQQPKFVDALANLSTILEQQHQLDEAKSLANQALEIDPDHLIARLTLANIAAREKSFDEVTAHLLPLLQSQELSPVNYAMACGKCAYAYENKGEYQKAFSFYQDANQALYRFYKPQYQDLESFHGPAAIRRIENVIPDFEFSTGSCEATSPVFLIGFPRSGTTLLDQILSSHSRITVMEEKQNLEEICTRFPATEERLKALKNASDSELKKLR
jgi:tetratricopeptide (TPR) repeat protein